jgi:RimJ/RimL family protein N-acetyltransferase
LNVETPLRTAIYLSNKRLGLRAPQLSDADRASRWYDFAGDNVRDVVQELRRQESIPWGGNPVILLVAVDLASGEIAGGIRITRSNNRTSTLAITVPDDGADRDEILAGILGLVVPWLMEEVGLMSVVLEAPADDAGMIDAAVAAGMVEAVRRREHLVRPGWRVDLLQLERVNLEWGTYAG